MAYPNSNRSINKPITISCITTDLEKQMVLRASRLILDRFSFASLLDPYLVYHLFSLDLHACHGVSYP
jgi:hypothetical protein